MTPDFRRAYEYGLAVSLCLARVLGLDVDTVCADVRAGWLRKS
jgi:hypothetical protein